MAQPAAETRITAESPVVEDELDGGSRSIEVDGLIVEVRPFRVVRTTGLSASQCGLVVQGQRVMTLGSGDLDALPV